MSVPIGNITINMRHSDTELPEGASENGGPMIVTECYGEWIILMYTHDEFGQTHEHFHADDEIPFGRWFYLGELTPEVVEQ
jgi:hypothetical protein